MEFHYVIMVFEFITWFLMFMYVEHRTKKLEHVVDSHCKKMDFIIDMHKMEINAISKAIKSNNK